MSLKYLFVVTSIINFQFYTCLFDLFQLLITKDNYDKKTFYHLTNLQTNRIVQKPMKLQLSFVMKSVGTNCPYSSMGLRPQY